MILTNRKDGRRARVQHINIPSGKTIILMPGDNVIDDEVWSEISEMKYVQRKIDNGDLIATEAPRIIKEVKTSRRGRSKKSEDDILG